MLFIDEIKNKDELKELLIEKYRFIKFINYKFNNKILSKIKDILMYFIYNYIRFCEKYIKKIIKLENDGAEINLIYFININKKSNEIVNKERNYSKFSSNVIKFIKKHNIATVTLSNDLMENNILNENLKNEKIHIINEKVLYEKMVFRIIEYISNIKKTNIEKYEISILMKNKDRDRINKIKSIIKNCKIVNIITSNVSQFDKLSEEMKNDYGIYLNITSNIEKSLTHSDIIINYDFDPEFFMKCNIPRFAILFNVSKKIKIYSNEFLGINITDYEILMPDKYNVGKKILNRFSSSKIYESIMIFNNILPYEIERRVENDNIKIRYLIGNNGKIRCREFINVKNKKMIKIKANKRLDKNKEKS